MLLADFFESLAFGAACNFNNGGLDELLRSPYQDPKRRKIRFMSLVFRDWPLTRFCTAFSTNRLVGPNQMTWSGWRAARARLSSGLSVAREI